MVGTKLKDKILPRGCLFWERIPLWGISDMQTREVAQAGIEPWCRGLRLMQSDCYGNTDVYGFGLKGFQIDIGQVEFFKGIIQEADITPENIEDIRRLMIRRICFHWRYAQRTSISNEQRIFYTRFHSFMETARIE